MKPRSRLLWNGIAIGFVLVSYVVNIGFSRNWKKWPSAVSAMMLMSIAPFGYIQSGQIETPLLAQAVHAWELYIFSHLGLAFVAGIPSPVFADHRNAHQGT